MNYCDACKMIVSSEALCPHCQGPIKEITDESPVTVAVIKGRRVSDVEVFLKEAGIPCSFENTQGDIYNAFNAKVNAESDFRVLVPFEFYNKAFDCCVNIGVVSDDERLIPDDREEEDTNKTYDERFEEANGMKHRTWQMIWTALFIIVACLLIWGVDFIAEYIKSLF